ncbi:MAG: hypothetical protein F2534_23570 [Actinobacteria bacterium]|uniref:Unannotated protein n=1 Tax=freshwater metagenome TaxID=449393 RepID=A0A6J6GTP6_9ZZZZ|nr:hypothetical protein [Actinomycetota bacterium]
MAAATEPQLLRLAQAHQDQLLAIRDRSAAVLARLWSSVVTNPSEFTAGQWLAASIPVLDASMQAAAASTLAYVSAYTAAATETAPTPARFTADEFTRPRGGVALEELLRRPIVTLRSALAKGEPFDRASQLGSQRAAQIGATDPMLASRAAGSAAMKAEPRIVGYRRVPDGGACAFCRLAATQRYRDSDLMAMHSSCGCSVAPIVGDRDPGQIIDRQALASLKADGVIDEISLRRYISSTDDVVASYQANADKWRREARDTDDQAAETRYSKRADDWARKAEQRALDVDAARKKLKAIQQGRLDKLTAVHDHGELGPVLYPAGVKFSAA